MVGKLSNDTNDNNQGFHQGSTIFNRKWSQTTAFLDTALDELMTTTTC